MAQESTRPARHIVPRFTPGQRVLVNGTLHGTVENPRNAGFVTTLYLVRLDDPQCGVDILLARPEELELVPAQVLPFRRPETVRVVPDAAGTAPTGGAA